MEAAGLPYIGNLTRLIVLEYLIVGASWLIPASSRVRVSK
jgi:hypothetical protein